MQKTPHRTCYTASIPCSTSVPKWGTFAPNLTRAYTSPLPFGRFITYLWREISPPKPISTRFKPTPKQRIANSSRLENVVADVRTVYIINNRIYGTAGVFIEGAGGEKVYLGNGKRG
ncbi:hypothetical protein GWI33_011738 [Rhynchophorus ferrugineus]|uniref:Uncharacterized protein n=1 Tax=Rhynchophorus ferrugineus TaxID=354439 RepID=A0A834I9U4_RHYFE|nr:hypothetical protein GWI33_011738 [Rhynchophorus ferrugineus]